MNIKEIVKKRILKKENATHPALKAVVGLSMGPLLALWVLLSGCGEPNEPFNSVNRFRMLAIRAEPPSLAEGELAELSALLHVPEGQEVTYKWSWCPFATSPRDGTECLVSEEDLAAFVRAYVAETVGQEAEAALPEVLPSFDLGTNPTAPFLHAVPAELLGEICTQMISDQIPAFTGLPRCDDKLDVVIRLEVESNGETLYGIKKLPLYINGERADNENPWIDGLDVLDRETDRAFDEIEGVTPLRHRNEYRLEAGISEEVADTFVPLSTDDNPNPVPVRESLFITWYVTGGETEFTRTTFFDGEIPFEELRENFWRVPAADTMGRDPLMLYLVIQDERGGIGWLAKRFELTERVP